MQQPMANQSPLVWLHVIFPPKVIRLVRCMLDHFPCAHNFTNGSILGELIISIFVRVAIEIGIGSVVPLISSASTLVSVV